MSFISALATWLRATKEVQDLSRNREFVNFDFIGVKDSSLTLDVVALVNADTLTEREIVERRNQFFEIVRSMPREFNFRPGARNPNGVLCFVFAQGCSEPRIKFISKQSKISHSATKGAVIVSWTIDLQTKQVHPHRSPVSAVPPVLIMPTNTFPTLATLQAFLNGYSQQTDETPHQQITHSLILEEPKDLASDRSHCLNQIERYQADKRHLETQIAAYGGPTFAPLHLHNQLREVEAELELWTQRLHDLDGNAQSL